MARFLFDNNLEIVHSGFGGDGRFKEVTGGGLEGDVKRVGV